MKEICNSCKGNNPTATRCVHNYYYEGNHQFKGETPEERKLTLALRESIMKTPCKELTPDMQIMVEWVNELKNED